MQPEVKTISVNLSTLDKVFNAITLEPPVLLKLVDLRYASTTLRGGRDTWVDYVILEASFKPMYEGKMLFMDIVRLMDEYGFQFLRPVGWLSEPKTGEILQMDTLFKRTKKSRYVISTRGEISLCHFDERRNLAMSFRRKEKSRYVIST
jgi:hypothetical protein